MYICSLSFKMDQLNFLVAVFLLCEISIVKGLQCWTCENAVNNDDCQTRGKLVQCRYNERSCQTEIRIHDFTTGSTLISKKCHQTLACQNNQLQNDRPAWFPTQCNGNSENSVCRCCCSENGCNSGLCEEDIPDIAPDARSISGCSHVTPSYITATCNGIVVVTSIPVSIGTSCRYTCPKNLDRIGPEEATCTVDVWDKDVRKIACQCKEEKLKNGQKKLCSSPDGNAMDSTCIYECNEGYAFENGETQVLRTCGVEGWNVKLPKCVAPKTCEIKIQDYIKINCTGVIADNLVSLNTVCTMSCPDSTDLTTDATATCTENDWDIDISATRCKCDDNEIKNGGKVCEQNGVIGSVCRYTCDEGHLFPTGAKELNQTCNVGGWNPTKLQSCYEICPSINLKFGSVSCDNGNNFKSTCNLSCDKEYKLSISGSSRVQCVFKENLLRFDWNEKPAICIAKPTCKLAVPEYVSSSCSMKSSKESYILENEVCEFTCPPFMKLNVRSKATCTASDWNIDINNMACSCPVDKFDYGIVKCDKNSQIGSFCKYTCNAGYSFPGMFVEIVRSCGLNGWDKQVPKCYRDCKSIDLSNGITTCGNSFNFGSVCDLTCNQDYKLSPSGSSRVKCIYDKSIESTKWDAEPATCIRIPTCQHITPIYIKISCSGKDTGLFTYEDSTCHYSCPGSTSLIGFSSATCSAKGWIEDISQTACACSNDVFENGQVNCEDNRKIGTYCEYTCNNGYAFAGKVKKHIRNCRINGWDIQALPKCYYDKCDEVTGPAKSVITCSNENRLDSSCSYKCEEGFVLDPISYSPRVCGTNGQKNFWVPDTQPCCKRSCPNNAKADIVFVLDSSASIQKENFKAIKDFVQYFIKESIVGEESVKFAVFRYSQLVDAVTQIYFNSYNSNKELLLKLVEKIHYSEDGTKTAEALWHVLEHVSRVPNGRRMDARLFVIVITDGKSQDRVRKPADFLHKYENATIIPVPVATKELSPKLRVQLINHMSRMTIREQDRIIKNGITPGSIVLTEKKEELKAAIGSIICQEKYECET